MYLKSLRNIVVFAVIALAFVCSVPAGAQVLKGSISGSVVDPQGTAIANAEVSATNVDTNVVSKTTSNNTGFFRLNLLPAGKYSVDITAQGHQADKSASIAVVKTGVDTGLGNVMLPIASSAGMPGLIAPNSLVNTTQAQVLSTVSGVTLETFPGIQENEGIDRLALFTPGVDSARSNNFGNSNGAIISTNGLRGRSNDQEIDGQFNNDNNVGGPYLFVSDTNFVDQYVLVTNNFDPEYGRNLGSVVNIITRQGTNNWHGNIFGNENNSFLNALNNTQRNTFKPGTTEPFTGPPRSNEEFSGGTIGGPLAKNKAFIFGGFDNDIFSGNSVFTTTQLTPTPAGLAELAACPGVNATALNVLDNFGPYGITFGNPTPRPTGSGGTFLNRTVAGCTVQFGGVTRMVPTPVHGYNWILRADTPLSANDTLTGRYVFNRSTAFNLGDNGPGGWVFNEPALSQAVLLSETHNFSPSMANELRGGFSRLNVEFGGGLNPLEPNAGDVANAFTNIIIQGGFLGLGPATNLPQGRIIDAWQAQDNWNWVLGKHSLKAGVNWTYQRTPDNLQTLSNGQYRFSSFTPFITTDQPNQILIARGRGELDFREYDTFTYFGDDWKIGQNLTLNLGLTWSYFGSPSNLLNQLTTARESDPATAFWLQSLPLSVRTAPSIPAVTNNFGPSIGFAYTPHWGGFLTGNGKTTFRGGYRLSYDPLFYNMIQNVAGSSPQTFQQTLNATSTPSVTGNLLPAVPTGPNVQAALAGTIAPNTFDPRTLAETVNATNLRPEKVHSWTFGFEREITKSSAFEARYAGNHALDLFQTVDGNPYLGTATAPGLLQTFPQFVPNASSLTPCPTTQQSGPGAGTDVGRVNCGEGVVRVRGNGGFSDYNALQLEFRANNLFKQLTMRTGYTWSKTLDNVSEIFATGTAGNTVFAAQNPFETGNAERSISGLNFPNVWTIVFTEQLPFFREQHGIGHLLGGWSIAGDYILASGQPYTPIQGFFEAVNTTGSIANYYDRSFVTSFLGADAARPFYGSLSAPVNTVGIYAVDFCRSVFGITPAANNSFPGACNTNLTSPSQLISYNAMNGNGGIASSGAALPGNPGVPVTANDVRFIINAAFAQSVFGTPFGNVPRNALTDAKSNIVNLSVFKNFKFGERAGFEIHATALNAFNHFNFGAIDPNLEDAGVARFGSDFANPAVTTAAGRAFYVGGKITF